MTICKEMQRFREILDSNGIEWEDCSLEWPSIDGKTDYICCTYFEVGAYEFSVLNGRGTYGGYCQFADENKGLLEYYCITNEDEEPKGYLTAEGAWDACQDTVKDKRA